jgi:hypothetical protein
VVQFRYLGTIVTNQNLIQEEMKRRLNLAKACYHSVQNLLSSRLLYKNLKIRIYKTIILPIVLYGCENLSLTLREEHRLRVYALRRLFGPKRDEVTGDFRKLHNEELHNLYPSPSIITMTKSRRMRLTGYIARLGRNACRYWWEGQKEKRELGIRRRRWVDNIKTDLR